MAVAECCCHAYPVMQPMNGDLVGPSLAARSARVQARSHLELLEIVQRDALIF